MATIANTSKQVAGSFTVASIALATSGDILTYTADTSQELWLYNTSASPVVVTIDGAGGTTVVVPDTGGTTLSVAAGYTITVAANSFATVALDKIKAFLNGVVSISAATGAVVKAGIVY